MASAPSMQPSKRLNPPSQNTPAHLLNFLVRQVLAELLGHTLQVLEGDEAAKRGDSRQCQFRGWAEESLGLKTLPSHAPSPDLHSSATV